MAGRIVRIRDRNQVTLPAEALDALSLHTGDFLEISVSSEGVLNLAPKRLVTWNTSEAERADQEAEADIAQNRYRTFESSDAFTADLLERARPAPLPQNATPKGKDLAKKRAPAKILKALEMSRGSRVRAAAILGINPKTLDARLKRYRLPVTEKS